MNPGEFEAYLRAQIPITAAMGLRVVTTEPEVRLRFPLEPNLNHHCTGFGGSLAAAGILAGWSVVALALRRDGIEADLVVAESTQRFRRPAATDFDATAGPLDSEAWAEFRETLLRRGKARLTVESLVGEDQVLLTGQYVALRPVDNHPADGG